MASGQPKYKPRCVLSCHVRFNTTAMKQPPPPDAWHPRGLFESQLNNVLRRPYRASKNAPHQQPMWLDLCEKSSRSNQGLGARPTGGLPLGRRRAQKIVLTFVII
jgi:hypothetical protein